jgi:hypothetical protein
MTLRNEYFPVTMHAPGSIGPSNGMQRMVAFVWFFFGSSFFGVTSQFAQKKTPFPYTKNKNPDIKVFSN